MGNTIEVIRNQKAKRISEICELKNIDIHDDYFWDIFKDSETNNEIFRAMSSRFFNRHPELVDETLDDIIKQLENFNPIKN